MKTQITERTVKLWRSPCDTAGWARKPGASWPCSTLAGHRVFAEFDSNGLLDFALNSGRGEQDCDSHELSAMAADFLRPKLSTIHPAYAVAVAQFV